MPARPVQPRRMHHREPSDAPLASCLALVAAVWLALFVTQSIWPGDAGVAVSFALALVLVVVVGCDRAATKSHTVTRERRSRVSRDPWSGALCPCLRFAQRCLACAGWCLLGLLAQPWLGALAVEGLLLLSSDVGAPHPRAELGLWRTMSWLVLAPAFEEALYRGRLFTALARNGGAGLAIPTTALFFALPHAGSLAVFAVLLAGLTLGALRARTGRVGPCIAMHAGFNIAAAIGATPSLRAG